MVRQLLSSIVLLVLFGSVQGQDAGFFLDEWQERTAVIPDCEWKDKPTDAPTLLINAALGQALKKVPTYIYGNNAVTWGGNMNEHATVMTDINHLNPHVLRWPGGNLSQEYFWNLSAAEPPGDVPVGFSPRYGVNDDWQMSTLDYYDLLQNTNSTGSICVNYSYARYGTGSDPVAKAAHLAAEWVRFDAGRSRFWEIGNENFGSWEAGYEIDVNQNQDGQPRYISGQLYGQHCRVFIDSMRAAAAEVGADIKIGVVAYDAENSYDPISQVWNEGMMPEVGHLADFLIVHSYFTPHNQDSNIPTILNSHDEASHIMDAVVDDMQESGQDMIPVAMTEWNIFAVGSMQMVSYINGMHAALVLGELVLNNYGLATRWDLTNGWNNGDDHGMFSRAGEPGVDHFNPRPVFFYMKYFQDYFGDRIHSSSVSGSEQVISYASSFTSGEAGLVIVNKGSSGEIVEVNLENHLSGARYYTMILTGGEDNGDFSRKVFLNGHGTDEEGGGPDEYESVKAYASSTREGILVDLPPLSVVYLMVESPGPLSYVSSKIESDPQIIQVELSEAVMPLDDPAGFEVMLNGATSVGITAIERDAENPWLLNVSLDRIIRKGDQLLLSYTGGAVITSEGESLPAFENQEVRNYLPGGPYQVSFLLKVSESDVPVANCEVSFNGVAAFSDESGRVVFSETDGTYSFSARKEYLDPVDEAFYTIYSDTLFDLGLDSTSYKVVFRLTDSSRGMALSSVEISAGGKTATTGLEGEAELLLHGGAKQFTLSAAKYLDINKIYIIESDSVFSLALERTHATVKFRLKKGEEPVNNALVVLGSDSLYTGQVGSCSFESVSLGQSLEYHISKDNYLPLNGDLIVGWDTTINVSLVLTALPSSFNREEIRIWPNPAQERIFIESPGRDICGVELLDMQGRQMSMNQLDVPRGSCKLALDFLPGIYLLKIRTSSGRMHSSCIVIY